MFNLKMIYEISNPDTHFLIFLLDQDIYGKVRFQKRTLWTNLTFYEQKNTPQF